MKSWTFYVAGLSGLEAPLKSGKLLHIPALTVLYSTRDEEEAEYLSKRAILVEHHDSTIHPYRNLALDALDAKGAK